MPEVLFNRERPDCVIHARLETELFLSSCQLAAFSYLRFYSPAIERAFTFVAHKDLFV
jgi:hypothetical protein